MLSGTTIARMRRDGLSATARQRLGRLVVAVALTPGAAACDGDDGDTRPDTTKRAASPSAESSATSATKSPSAAPLFGKAVLIETRVLDAVKHKGVVRRTSRIGESPFCPGGRARGGSDGAAITTTFYCSGGTLTVRYSPAQRSLVQGAAWEIVSGTGNLADLRGGGSMVAVFERTDPDSGREVFTGTVGE